MLTSLQALLRLASLRWLGVFVCALATLLATTSTASALEPAQTKTRVWGFELAGDNTVGLFRAASPRTHLENRSSSAEEASGSLLAARGAEGTVSLYRAVSPAEFADIARIGGFRAAPGGSSLAAKQFGTSLDEAVTFANQYPELAAVIRVEIPQSTFNQLQFSRSIDSFIFRGGVVSAQPGAQQQLLNQTIITLEHAF